MKKFMKTCYKCGTEVKPSRSVKDGIRLGCMKCPRCGEEYYTSSELVKFDILSGKRKMVRKFGVLGDSTIVRVPNQIIREFDLKPGDYGVFEKSEEGILIKPYKAEDLGA